MSKQKILFIVNGLSPYRLDFFSQLAKKCNLTVLCEKKKSKDRSWDLEEPRNQGFILKIMKGISTSNDSSLCPSVIFHLKRNKFDLVILGNYSTPTGILASMYMQNMNIPYAIEVDGGIIKSGIGFKEKFKERLISSANFWISPSNESDKYLKFYKANQDYIYRYVFSSIWEKDILDNILSQSKKNSFKDKLDIKEDKVVLSVGKFIYRKGFDLLLKACKSIDKNVGVYIVGGNPTEEYLKMKEEMNLNNVHFVGFKQKKDLKDYYLAADLFVLPTREDVWGLVINEAMAYGLPVITTDKCIAGLELVKNHENGFIVPVDDEKKLADKMNIVLSDDELRGKMAQSSLYKIREYTIENMANKHMEIFESIIDKNLYSD